MAKLTRTLRGDFGEVLNRVVKTVLNGSVSATLEDSWEVSRCGSRCAVRVFERYSYMGGNRVSMSVTLFQDQTGGPIELCAITSGGSQATFFKINTIGEEAFLDTLRSAF